MIGDPVPHVRSLLAAIYHGACWVPARPPVSPSLPLARVIWPVFTTTLRPASVVAAAERNELWNGRTSGASPGAFARFFFFLLAARVPGAPDTWRGGTGRAISLRSGGGDRAMAARPARGRAGRGSRHVSVRAAAGRACGGGAGQPLRRSIRRWVGGMVAVGGSSGVRSLFPWKEEVAPVV